MDTRTKYYRVKGDRKFFSSDFREVVEYISIKKNLEPIETNTLLLYGRVEVKGQTIEIHDFFTK